MKLLSFRSTLGAVILALTVAAKAGEHSNQGCAALCWENSKYVSDCGDSIDCLCKDADFQNAVHQCIYVQCPTSVFGPALHYVLAMCSADTSSAVPTPQLIRYDALRKRGDLEYNYGSVSNSVYASATRSGHFRSVTVSASASARPTRSTHRGSAYVSASASRSAFRVKRAKPTPF